MQAVSTLKVQNIMDVANAIEQHSIEGLGFNMGVIKTADTARYPDQSGQGCQTVACIAGWTLSLFKPSKAHCDEQAREHRANVRRSRAVPRAQS